MKIQSRPVRRAGDGARGLVVWVSRQGSSRVFVEWVVVWGVPCLRRWRRRMCQTLLALGDLSVAEGLTGLPGTFARIGLLRELRQCSVSGSVNRPTRRSRIWQGSGCVLRVRLPAYGGHRKNEACVGATTLSGCSAACSFVLRSPRLARLWQRPRTQSVAGCLQRHPGISFPGPWHRSLTVV